MIDVLTAPKYKLFDKRPSLFLAGGITGCDDWQNEAIGLIEDEFPRNGGNWEINAKDIVVYNPRREDWDVNDPNASDEQIEWEFHHLNTATHILFWFPSESLCPITLYELGAYTKHGSWPTVGTMPSYPRRFDVVKQTELRGGIVHDALDTTVKSAVTLLVAKAIRGISNT